MAVYNLAILATPPLAYGIFERDVDESCILQYPRLYKRTQSWAIFNPDTLSRWWLTAVYHSTVLFFLAAILFEEDPRNSNGKAMGLHAMGNMVMSVGVVVVVLELALVIDTWNIVMHVLVWGSILGYLLIFWIESQLPTLVPAQYNQFEMIFSDPLFYFYAILAIFLCLAPEFVSRYFSQQYHPEDRQILREAAVLKKTGKAPFASFKLFRGKQGVEEQQQQQPLPFFEINSYSWRLSRADEGTGLPSQRNFEDFSQFHDRVGSQTKGDYHLLV